MVKLNLRSKRVGKRQNSKENTLISLVFEKRKRRHEEENNVTSSTSATVAKEEGSTVNSYINMSNSSGFTESCLLNKDDIENPQQKPEKFSEYEKFAEETLEVTTEPLESPTLLKMINKTVYYSSIQATNLFIFSNYKDCAKLHSLLIQVSRDFHLNDFEFSYLINALCKIKHDYSNLKLDVYMTAFAIKIMLNTEYKLDVKILAEFNFSFEMFFNNFLLKQGNFSFCCASVRELNLFFKELSSMRIVK